MPASRRTRHHAACRPCPINRTCPLSMQRRYHRPSCHAAAFRSALQTSPRRSGFCRHNPSQLELTCICSYSESPLTRQLLWIVPCSTAQAMQVSESSELHHTPPSHNVIVSHVHRPVRFPACVELRCARHAHRVRQSAAHQVLKQLRSLGWVVAEGDCLQKRVSDLLCVEWREFANSFPERQVFLQKAKRRVNSILRQASGHGVACRP